MLLTPEEVRAMRESNVLARARMFWALADEVAAIYGVTVVDMKGRDRGSMIANEARKQLCKAALARGLSSVQVGKWLGGRDHSTILKAAGPVDRGGETTLVFVSRRG